MSNTQYNHKTHTTQTVSPVEQDSPSKDAKLTDLRRKPFMVLKGKIPPIKKPYSHSHNDFKTISPMKVHYIKVNNLNFSEIDKGNKTFEVATSGFEIKENDIVVLQEHDLCTRLPLGNFIVKQVGYVGNELHFCLPGYVIFSLLEPDFKNMPESIIRQVKVKWESRQHKTDS